MWATPPSPKICGLPYGYVRRATWWLRHGCDSRRPAIPENDAFSVGLRAPRESVRRAAPAKALPRLKGAISRPDAPDQTLTVLFSQPQHRRAVVGAPQGRTRHRNLLREDRRQLHRRPLPCCLPSPGSVTTGPSLWLLSLPRPNSGSLSRRATYHAEQLPVCGRRPLEFFGCTCA